MPERSAGLPPAPHPRRHPRPRRRRGWYACLQGAARRRSWSGLTPAAPQTAASAAPVNVSLVRAERRDMPVVLKPPAPSALTSVDVKPQMASVVTQVHVKEGQFVRRGDLLFTLDSRSDQTNLGKAQAQLPRIWPRWPTLAASVCRAAGIFAQELHLAGARSTPTGRWSDRSRRWWPPIAPPSTPRA